MSKDQTTEVHIPSTKLDDIWLEQIFYSGSPEDEQMFHVDLHGILFGGTEDETPCTFNIQTPEVMAKWGFDPVTTWVRVFRQSTNNYDAFEVTLGSIWANN